MSLGTRDIVNRQLEEQINGFEKDLESSNEKASIRRKCLMTIAEKVCDSQYGNMQLGGKNNLLKQSDYEIRDFIIKNVLEQKIKFTQNIRDLQKIYIESQREKEELGRRVLELEEELANARNVYQVNTTTSSFPPLQQNDANETSAIEPPPIENTENLKKEDMLISGSDVYNIDKEFGKINIYHLEVINAIGTFGYSETNDIVSECLKHMDVKETYIRQTIAELVDFNMLSLDKISTPIRKTLSLYGLTKLGEAIYKKEHDKKPVKCEKVKLVEMHASINHAYCIKDTAKVLADLGYRNICYDGPSNTIDVADGRRYVPDIIADFDDNTKTYWEVELGHHKDGDFFDKLDKATKVTNIVYVIVNDAQTWEKVKKQVVGYKLKLNKEGRKIKLTVYLGTMTQLSKKSVFFQNPDCKFIMG